MSCGGATPMSLYTACFLGVPMRASTQKGVSFGLSTGVITTLGLMIGLEAGTAGRSVVLAGIITIALADALSDSLGMHLSEESAKRSHKGVWGVTFSTFLTKMVIALSFGALVLLLPLGTAIRLSLIWGFVLLIGLSWWIARQQKRPSWESIGEHILIAAVVVVLARLVGVLVSSLVA